jgi:hypothetical protein
MIIAINSNVMTLFVNGSNIGSVTIGSNDRWNNPNATIFIGSYSGSNYHKGLIPKISIYNRALSAAEVSQNFNALRGRFGI